MAFRPSGARWLLVLAAALTAACDATTRHKVLTYFFDGVPPLESAAPPTAPGQPSLSAASTALSVQEHGPYAAKLCAACHSESLGNTLVAPADQLCQRCHELKMDARYVHGPLASGGCLVCHDPHSSRTRPLLVSEPEGFCFHCHDRETVLAIPGHGNLQQSCTECHDAHMSNSRYLLK
jgi:predicted CXXCH cytochrome family protein